MHSISTGRNRDKKEQGQRMHEVESKKEMSEDMLENMSKMRENVCYGSQGKCLWVMLHFAVGNAAKIMLCYLIWRTAANSCGSTFRVQASEVGLAAMSGLVVQRPATIFIGASSRFAKGVGYVWRYVLITVGPECIYVCMEPPSTTHAGNCMLIVPQVVEGTLWHVVYGVCAKRLAGVSWNGEISRVSYIQREFCIGRDPGRCSRQHACTRANSARAHFRETREFHCTAARATRASGHANNPNNPVGTGSPPNTTPPSQAEMKVVVMATSVWDTDDNDHRIPKSIKELRFDPHCPEAGCGSFLDLFGMIISPE